MEKLTSLAEFLRAKLGTGGDLYLTQSQAAWVITWLDKTEGMVNLKHELISEMQDILKVKVIKTHGIDETK